ncbi:hypothetical protein CAPTEDRAFT_5577 [Capitella teleta]|uniref:UDP-glucuronosyltransferase n=1 Tax=Capitella teleta TaxID=283909 RepID=R7THI2_CAPTE|nr:hypothetical protein CAPTEDRAFT_5577 [Capitella teleta]|eukprot:ELT93263.1 hypothetical protein CAPTEDRAFT_5577 [Capitella teleta]
MERYCNNLLQDTALLHRLKDANYDLLIVESLDPCSRILADYLDIPFVPLMSTGLGHLDGNPRPPSYVPSAISPYTSRMTFLQRMGNLVMKVLYDTIPIVMGLDAPFEILKQTYGLNTSMSISDTYNRASIKLVNSDFAIDYPTPIEPDTVMVGGFAVRTPAPLPSELEEFMQSSGQHGVIVVSFGTLVKNFNLDWTRVFVESLSRLPQKVLWRYYGDHDAVMNMTADVSNIRLMRWLPQSDLLAHPKTKLFITHCGLNGMFETTHHGVPVVAIPLTGDQHNHASKLVEHLQMGIKLDIFDLDASKLYDAAETVLSRPTYKTNARVASSRLRDHPLSATDRVSFWVDYVIRHGGAPHLKSTAHMLTWYQYLSLDVIFCVVCFFSLALTIVLIASYKMAVFFMNKKKT